MSEQPADPKVIDLAAIRAGKPPPQQPTIRVTAGMLDVTATAAEKALIESDLPIYQRGSMLVRPVLSEVPASRGRTTTAAGLATINNAAMTDRLCRAAIWEKYDGRAKGYRRIDPPGNIAATVLSRYGEWRFPSIAGVITTPTIRPDGSLLTEPGYDQATRLYHAADPDLKISVPTNPTIFHAEAALNELLHLLAGFPTVAEVDTAVALSGLISPLVRGACGVVPLHAFRASTAGTGKSYLVDVASAIATARACPVATVAKDEAETEKRLTGLLIAGFPLICLDNVNGELGGDLLCQAIERPIVQVRPLGSSEIIEIESRATVFATGNALRVRGDMTRRTIIGNLDAAMEQPELRRFDFDPVELVLTDRAKYVSAVLTIVLSHAAAGFPGTENIQPLASFDAWSRYVRSALIWLGCADPCLSIEQARADDPEILDLIELLSGWKEEFGSDGSYTVAEITEMVANKRYAADEHDPAPPYKYPKMRAMALRIAGGRSGIDGRRLGLFFRQKEGRIIQGTRLRKASTASGGVIRWQVVAV